jgi:predicted RND superfamily exporter protein
MNDLATPEMDIILSQLKPKIDSIFLPQDSCDVVITGSSRVFLEGTKYLVGNLSYSLLLVILLISIFMAWMFRSFRMVIVSLIPNLIPLLLTAAIMGYFSIPIKPSTILVFSIAFGISVDDTIHFLAKYRQELVSSNWNIKKSVFNALEETGISMIYTSVVLFCGFFVFVASDFGGTQSLGLLVSITLLFAMLSNLLLLPALLLTLERRITTKSFKEPLIDIFDEEEDIDLKKLKVKIK